MPDQNGACFIHGNKTAHVLASIPTPHGKGAAGYSRRLMHQVSQQCSTSAVSRAANVQLSVN